MKAKSRIKRTLEIAKGTLLGAGIGGVLGIYFNLMPKEKRPKDTKEEHLKFLIRLNETTELVQRIISDAYDKVKEIGFPASFDPHEMHEYQSEAKRIWTSEIVMNSTDDESSNGPLVH